MKQTICIALCLVTLLCLCACGSKAQHHAAADIFDANNPTSEPATAGFDEIVLYEDAYCAIIQTSAIYTQTNASLFDLKITNKTDGTLYCSLGKTVYINDIQMGKVFSIDCTGDLAEKYVSADLSEKTIIPPNKTLSGSCRIHTNARNRKLGIMCKIQYDNGETGVYNESFEVVNDIFIVNDPETAVTNRYVQTGEELLVMENERYRIIGISCAETEESGSGSYNISLYIENKTAVFETFCFKELIQITSDRQDRIDRLSSPGKSILLAPCSGYYLTVTLSKKGVDSFAKDISEVVTVTIPVTVSDSKDLSFPQTGYTWSDDAEISFTRDQLVQ